MKKEKYKKIIDNLLNNKTFGLIKFPIPEKPNLQFLELITKMADDIEYSRGNYFYIRLLKLEKYRKEVEKICNGLLIVCKRFHFSDIYVGSSDWNIMFRYVLNRYGNVYIQDHQVMYRPNEGFPKLLTTDVLKEFEFSDLKCLILYGFLDNLLEKEKEEIATILLYIDNIPF